MLGALAIFGTLSALAIPRLQDAIDQARIAKAIGDIDAMQVDITGFSSQSDQLPASLADVGRGGIEDPWGNPYRYYPFPATGGIGQARKDRFLVPLNSQFDLYSVGKDGASAPAITASESQDDIIRANDGGFVGLARNY